MSWTGAQYMNLPMGYICEKRDEGCKIKENSPLIFDRYEIIPPKNPETVDFDQARLQCQLKGAQWDLAVFNSNNEFSEIQSRIENNCVDDIAYWVGYTEENEIVLTVSGRGGFLQGYSIPRRKIPIP